MNRNEFTYDSLVGARQTVLAQPRSYFGGNRCFAGRSTQRMVEAWCAMMVMTTQEEHAPPETVVGADRATIFSGWE